MATARHWLISGRVQGVSFRWFTREQAMSLGLVGTVKNLSDGRVEVFVAGPEDRLEELRRKIREGPRMARVTAIDEFELESHRKAELLTHPSFDVLTS